MQFKLKLQANKQSQKKSPRGRLTSPREFVTYNLLSSRSRSIIYFSRTEMKATTEGNFDEGTTDTQRYERQHDKQRQNHPSHCSTKHVRHLSSPLAPELPTQCRTEDSARGSALSFRYKCPVYRQLPRQHYSGRLSVSLFRWYTSGECQVSRNACPKSRRERTLHHHDRHITQLMRDITR
jgi:hypothetical protein